MHHLFSKKNLKLFVTTPIYEFRMILSKTAIVSLHSIN